MEAERGDGDASTLSWRTQVGAQLQAERERRGWKVEDIARRLNLRPSFVAALEQGRGMEHMNEAYEWSHMKSIAGLLDVDVQSHE